MSLLTDVLAQVQAGTCVDRIPGVLGADPGLVAAALDHWERVGVVVAASDALAPGCASGCGVRWAEGDSVTSGSAAAEPLALLGCAGCVFRPRQRSSAALRRR